MWVPGLWSSESLPVYPCPASLWGDLGLLISVWLWPWLLSLWFGFWMARAFVLGLLAVETWFAFRLTSRFGPMNCWAARLPPVCTRLLLGRGFSYLPLG